MAELHNNEDSNLNTISSRSPDRIFTDIELCGNIQNKSENYGWRRSQRQLATSKCRSRLFNTDKAVDSSKNGHISPGRKTRGRLKRNNPVIDFTSDDSTIKRAKNSREREVLMPIKSSIVTGGESDGIIMQTSATPEKKSEEEPLFETPSVVSRFIESNTPGILKKVNSPSTAERKRFRVHFNSDDGSDVDAVNKNERSPFGMPIQLQTPKKRETPKSPVLEEKYWILYDLTRYYKHISPCFDFCIPIFNM
uniref:Uncharacterized protein n=1 Tax=Heterorhabditis bacteriophora TaxID=37862 RepID=A0A1I7X9M1_HETBA